MLRRDFLQKASLLALSSISGCATTITPAPAFGAAIDAHCHVFNASDLPVTRFLRYVVLKDYPVQAKLRTSGIQDKDFFDGLIRFAERFFGLNRAPTAKDETGVLSGRENASTRHSDLEVAGKVTTDVLADYLEEKLTPMRRGDLASLSTGDREFIGAVLEAGGSSFRTLATGSSSLRQTAASAYASGGQVGTLLRWIRLFTLYRHVLVETLISDARRQGLTLEMLTPALVDFDNWLGQSVEGSPIKDQILVMDRIARRTQGPAVHAYLGFDPLREVLFRREKLPGTRNPLELTREALAEHGFLGEALSSDGLSRISEQGTLSETRFEQAGGQRSKW